MVLAKAQWEEDQERGGAGCQKRTPAREDHQGIARFLLSKTNQGFLEKCLKKGRFWTGMIIDFRG